MKKYGRSAILFFAVKTAVSVGTIPEGGADEIPAQAASVAPAPAPASSEALPGSATDSDSASVSRVDEPADLSPPSPRLRLLQVSGEAHHSNLFERSQNEFRPVLSLDIFNSAASPWSLGFGLSDYSIAMPGSPSVKRTEGTFRMMYWNPSHLYGVGAHVGLTQTRFDRFDTNTGYHWGLDAKARLPIAKNLDLVFAAGWTRTARVELDRDTGVPVTDSAFSNAMCELFSFGLADDCGTVHERVTIPQSDAVHVGAGLSYSF